MALKDEQGTQLSPKENKHTTPAHDSSLHTSHYQQKLNDASSSKLDIQLLSVSLNYRKHTAALV
jgi:hypothetical protein